MTQIQALTPGGFTATITCPESEADPGAWLLEVDKWLTRNNFKPLPQPQSGGWNKGGKTNTPRNWVDVIDNTLYVFFGWSGANVEENNANKKEWQRKITEATGVHAEVDKTTFGKDAKGRDIWTYAYPIKVGVKLLEVLPADQFERKPALVERLAKAKKG